MQNSQKSQIFTCFLNDFISVEINECNSSPCDNGGTCVDGFNSFTCLCDPNVARGIRCEGTLNLCLKYRHIGHITYIDMYTYLGQV